VPGLLFFPDLVASLRPLTKKAFHVHLMVDNPLRECMKSHVATNFNIRRTLAMYVIVSLDKVVCS
jgi:pentose-5-phosphate-3-epimerase